MVGVAQLVELLIVVQVVAGSSPVTHPRCYSHANRRTCVPQFVWEFFFILRQSP